MFNVRTMVNMQCINMMSQMTGCMIKLARMTAFNNWKAPKVTYQGSKGLHGEAGSHHNQQVSLGEVSGHVLKEARRQALPKEHNVRFHQPLCSTAVLI